MASLLGAKVLVEYRANLVSDFDPKTSCFGERSFYCCLIKNLTPLRASPVRKRVQALNVIVRCYYYYEGPVIIHETFVFYKLDLDE
jgi:hypothetical protein